VLAPANTWTARHGHANLRAAFDPVAETQLAGLESPDGAAAEMVGPDLGTAGAQVHRIVGLAPSTLWSSYGA